jgi:hypothetical protein
MSINAGNTLVKVIRLLMVLTVILFSLVKIEQELPSRKAVRGNLWFTGDPTDVNPGSTTPAPVR